MRKGLGVEFVRQVESRIESKRSKKSKRTVVLSDENFKKLAALCKKDDVFLSEVLDELIAVYVEFRGKGGG